MAKFETAVTHLLQMEGSYSDQAADRGGKTRWGITEAVARRHGYGGDMADFPREQALAIYRSDYWDLLHADTDAMPDAVGTRLLDIAVNMGPVWAIRLLQRALGIPEDGIWGQQTASALGTLPPPFLDAKLRLAQIGRYRDIVAADREQGVFLLGWINRALA